MKHVLLINLLCGLQVLYANSTFVIAKKKNGVGQQTFSDEAVAQMAAEVVEKTNMIVAHINEIQKNGIASLKKYAHAGNFGSQEQKKVLQECLTHQKQILDQCVISLTSTAEKI